MVLLQHRLCHKCCDGLRVSAGCSYKPTTRLYQLRATMVCFPSTSTDHSSPTMRPLSFWLELKCWPIPLWFYSSTCYDTGAVMDWEYWQGLPIPITRLYQLWTTMVCLPSTSMDHSPTVIRPFRFWLQLKCWPISLWFYCSTDYATGDVMDWEC